MWSCLLIEFPLSSVANHFELQCKLKPLKLISHKIFVTSNGKNRDNFRHVWLHFLEITCDAPTWINNGYYEYKESLTSDGKYRLNSGVLYKCDKGYELKGDNTSICGEDGWSLGQRSCERGKWIDIILLFHRLLYFTFCFLL